MQSTSCSRSPAISLFADNSQTSWGWSRRKLTVTTEEKTHPPHLPCSSLYAFLEIYLQFIVTSGLDPGQEVTRQDRCLYPNALAHLLWDIINKVRSQAWAPLATCNSSFVTVLTWTQLQCSALQTGPVKQPGKDQLWWFFRSGQRCWVLPSQHPTIQASPKHPKSNTTSSSSQNSSHNYSSFQKITIFFFRFFFHLCYTSPCGSLDPSSVSLHHWGWGRVTFGYKISPNIWYRFDGCQHWELLLCREPGFGSTSLAGAFFLNRNSSTDHARAPGLLKLSQCNWVAPLPMAFVIRNAPFFPFQAAAAAWVSIRVILEGRLKRNPLLLHKWDHTGMFRLAFCAQ